MASVTDTAKALGVSRPAISNWCENGLPHTMEDGKVAIDIDAALAWKAKHHNPNPPKGGALPGAGRPKGSKSKPKEPEAPPSERDDRILKVKAGTATKAELDLTLQEGRVLDEEIDLKAKVLGLLKASDVEAAQLRAFTALRSALDGVPAAAAKELAALLNLTQVQQLEALRLIRKMIDRSYGQFTGGGE